MHIAFFGSSVTSSYWNGAATYYRGLTKALCALGHRVSFYEPDALDRQKHRDLDDPDWLHSIVYPARHEQDARLALERAVGADAVIKCSGVGVFDEYLEQEVLALQETHRAVAFLDVDAPATLRRVNSSVNDPFRELIPRYDAILTYGGGEPVIQAYETLGARQCVPIYNAADPEVHHPVDDRDPRFEADFAFLGNRLPDREARVEEFFFSVARQMPEARFILGGSGWVQDELPRNVRHIGHVYVHEHNAFNVSPLAVLNISRDSMAELGYSPATRVFEAAAAGACMITDEWEGIDQFFEPGHEILVAGSGEQVVSQLRGLTGEAAAEIGRAASARVLREHTYEDRAKKLAAVLSDSLTGAHVS